MMDIFALVVVYSFTFGLPASNAMTSFTVNMLSEDACVQAMDKIKQNQRRSSIQDIFCIGVSTGKVVHAKAR